MKLIILSVSFLCCTVLATAQTASLQPNFRPTTFQQVDLIAGYTPIEPFRKAARFTTEISELLQIEDEGTFDALLEANYQAELAIAKIQQSAERRSIEEIRENQKEAVVKLLTSSQYQIFLTNLKDETTEQAH